MSRYPAPEDAAGVWYAAWAGQQLRHHAFCSLVSCQFFSVYFSSSASFGCKSQKTYLFVLWACCLGYRLLWPAFFFFLRGIYCLKKTLKIATEGSWKILRYSAVGRTGVCESWLYFEITWSALKCCLGPRLNQLRQDLGDWASGNGILFSVNWLGDPNAHSAFRTIEGFFSS